MIQGIGNEVARSAGKLMLICVGIGACLFMLGLIIGFLLGGDSEKLKPVEDWDGPVGLEMRQRQMRDRSELLTQELINALNKCYPEVK